MPTTKNTKKLPRSFKALVAEMPPQAIMDDVHYENTVEMVDRLMGAGKLTKGQELYLETLVQLAQAYEVKHHAIDTTDLNGIDVFAGTDEQPMPMTPARQCQDLSVLDVIEAN